MRKVWACLALQQLAGIDGLVCCITLLSCSSTADCTLCNLDLPSHKATMLGRNADWSNKLHAVTMHACMHDA